MNGRTRLLGIVDQAVASCSNLVVTVAAARALAPEHFGGFAVAMVACIVIGGLVRALALEPLLVRGIDGAQGDRSAVAGAALGLGVIGAIGCMAVGAATSGPSSGALVVLGVFLPFLFLEDGLRYCAFASGQPQQALVLDLVWLLGLAFGLAFVPASPTAGTFVLLWGASGALAAAVGVAQVRATPDVVGAAGWVRRNLDLGGPFAVEFMTSGGVAYAGLWLLGATSGLAAVAAVRVGQTLYGPVNILYMGIYLTLVPQGARLRGKPLEVRRSMAKASGLLVGLAATAMAIAHLTPAAVGEGLFGDSWDESREVLIPLGVAVCAGGAMAGASAGLRALERARSALMVRLMTLPMMLLFPLLGAWVADEVGYSVGLAVAYGLAALAWWRRLFTETDHRMHLSNGQTVAETLVRDR